VAQICLLLQTNEVVEHIKYPDPKNAASQGSQGGNRRPPGQQQPSTQNSGQRPTSPPVSSDTDEGRRAVSPPGTRVMPLNSQMQPLNVQSIGTGPNGSRPPRPPRDEQGAMDLKEVLEGVSDAEDARQRMISPETTRSKSPTDIGTRSKSPNGVPPGPQPSAAAMIMSHGMNSARSPSPGGAPAPSDAFIYNNKPSALTNGRTSPVVGRPGSTGNIAAEIMRDLHAKNAELETLRRRETWMRAALSKASKAGFSWKDLSLDDDDDPSNHEPETGDGKRLLEIAFKLKQERANLQVS
jgi:hypothetical protein